MLMSRLALTAWTKFWAAMISEAEIPSVNLVSR